MMTTDSVEWESYIPREEVTDINLKEENADVSYRLH